jgi:hypothetical protein
MAGEVLKDQIDAVLDLWYGFVGSHPHLVYYFSGPDGKPDANYLAAVRQRFGQWILDTCNRPYDQDWLKLSARDRAAPPSHQKGTRRTTCAQCPSSRCAI